VPLAGASRSFGEHPRRTSSSTAAAGEVSAPIRRSLSAEATAVAHAGTAVRLGRPSRTPVPRRRFSRQSCTRRRTAKLAAGSRSGGRSPSWASADSRAARLLSSAVISRAPGCLPRFVRPPSGYRPVRVNGPQPAAVIEGERDDRWNPRPNSVSSPCGMDGSLLRRGQVRGRRGVGKRRP
jgi:hypothetical protein